MSDDTSRYGHVRKAVMGEVGTHLAMEDIRANEALIVHASNMMRQNAEIRVDIPMIFIRETQHIPSPDAWLIAERLYKRRIVRRRALWFWFWVLLVGAFCIAFSIDNFTSLTTVEPVHAAELAPPPVPPVSTQLAVVTAYTSSVDETDSTPFITASGTHTQPGTLACPAEYAFGTQVRIGDATYTCRDRMNAKYSHRFDVWVQTKAEAKARGIQKLPIEIL